MFLLVALGGALLLEPGASAQQEEGVCADGGSGPYGADAATGRALLATKSGLQRMAAVDEQVHYTDLGAGKCLASGQDPAHEYHGGKAQACAELCSSRASCHGYSASSSGNCLLWMQPCLSAGGGSWGGARCMARVPASPSSCQPDTTTTEAPATTQAPTTTSAPTPASGLCGATPESPAKKLDADGDGRVYLRETFDFFSKVATHAQFPFVFFTEALTAQHGLEEDQRSHTYLNDRGVHIIHEILHWASEAFCGGRNNAAGLCSATPESPAKKLDADGDGRVYLRETFDFFSKVATHAQFPFVFFTEALTAQHGLEEDQWSHTYLNDRGVHIIHEILHWASEAFCGTARK